MKKFIKNLWPFKQFFNTPEERSEAWGGVAAVGFTFRTLDNFMPVLDLFKEQGNAVNLVIFPHKSDPNSEKMAKLHHNVAVRYPVDHLNSESCLPFETLCEIVAAVTEKHKPKVWLIDDILSYPSNGIKRAVQAVNKGTAPPVVAFQHGFYQLWECYKQNFACDYFCCYGPDNLNYFDTGLRDRIIVSGLPKLDRLRDIEITQENYILFASQGVDSMAPIEPQGADDLYTLLEQVGTELKLPVKIKPHPEHVRPPEGLPEGFIVLDSQTDGIDAVRRANVVITTGSTLALESMVLGKTTVILPSISAGAYTGCPAVAEAYNAAAVVKVIDLDNKSRVYIDNYLDGVAANWRNFAAAAACYQAIMRIIP